MASQDEHHNSDNQPIATKDVPRPESENRAQAATPLAVSWNPLDWLDFYWSRFLTGFCYHLILPLILLLLAGIVAGRVGSEFGVRYVVFYDDPDFTRTVAKQLCAGMAFAGVALMCLFVGFLLEGVRAARGPAGDPVGGAPTPATTAPPPGPPVDGAGPTANGPGTPPANGAAAQPTPSRRGESAIDLQFVVYATGIVLCLAATLALVVLVGKLVRYCGLVRVLGWEMPEAPAVEPIPVLWWPFAVGVLLGVAAVAALAWVWGRAGRPLYEDIIHNLRTHLNESGPVKRVKDRLQHAAQPNGKLWLRTYCVGLMVSVFAIHVFVVSLLAAEIGWWLPAVAVGLFVAGLVLAAQVVLFPAHLSRLFEVLDQQAHQAHGPYPYHSTGLFFLTVGLVALVLLSQFPLTQSPAIAGAFLLFVLVAAYGFFNYVVRRATPVLVAGLVVTVLVGGLNPYKMRFPGLSYGQGALVDLRTQVQKDLAIQEEIDDRLARFLDSADYRKYEADRRQLDSERLEADLEARTRGGEPDPKKQADLKLRADALNGWLKHLEQQAGLRSTESPNMDAERQAVIPAKDPRREAEMPRARDDADLLGVEDTRFRPFEDGKRKQPLVLITVSGGGIRSSAWTLTVLHELEEAFAREKIDFPGHVRVICGASGGMLGASYYVLTLPPRDERVAALGAYPDARRTQTNAHYDRMTRDYLTPLVNRFAYNDLPYWLSPWPMPDDRGRALERAWAEGDALGPVIATKFSELRAREVSGDTPSLVFSPMLIEDGRRLLISNLDLRYVASNDCSQILDAASDPNRTWRPRFGRTLSQESFELFRLFPGRQRDFSVATAARMSATFPFFSPAVPIPTYPRRRVVDAGYYDNYGVSLVSSWLFSLKHRDWLMRTASKVLILQIRDGATEEHRRLQKVDPDGSTELSRAGEELTSPPEGLYNARVSSSSFRNDGQLEQLSLYFRDAEFSPDQRRRREGKDQPAQPNLNDRFFTTVVFEYQGEASLSWYLTGTEKQMIRNPESLTDEQIGKDRRDKLLAARLNRAERIQKLIAWWKHDPGGR